MIISASRRTDIPAFFCEWFMNRVRAGWCAVPNPMNAKQVSKVPLSPDQVDAIVFWSKNPAPLIPHLAELERRGYHYYIQYTLNDYPQELEPNVPKLDARIQTFLDLSNHVGPPRVVWRYDPIIISNITDHDFHRQKFHGLACELAGATERVVISLVDFYKKTERRLSVLEDQGFVFDRDTEVTTATLSLLKDISEIARQQGMSIFSCAEDHDFTNVGIPPGQCIDEKLLNRVWSQHLPYKKDPYQRKSCLCAQSKDIGMNDTCVHGCPYCYSTRNQSLAVRRYSEHNPKAPALHGDFNEMQFQSNSQQIRLFK